MTNMALVPLFLQSHKFSSVKAQLSFQGYSEIGYGWRLLELIKGIFYAITLRPTVAGEYCQAAWTGYKCALREFDPKEIHQWKLLLKINLQKDFILQSKNWKTVITACQETFQFAPDTK